jgi:hypothetical protein
MQENAKRKKNKKKQYVVVHLFGHYQPQECLLQHHWPLFIFEENYFAERKRSNREDNL